MTKAETNGHAKEAERVALYFRVSSEEQRDSGTIETQRVFLESYAELHGLQIAETYADDGVSGILPLDERPAGRRLLADAKAGKFASVIVYKLDRLGRSLLVTVEAHETLTELGVALISAHEHIDTSTPSGVMHFQMLGSFAQFERANIKQRTRDGLARAYRNGKHTGTLPYGYAVGEDGQLEVVPEEAAVVRDIFANIANGSTMYAEAKRLNDEGIEPPGWRYRSGRSTKRTSALWSEPTVHNLLRRRAYSGTHEVRAGDEVIERSVPAIVSEGLQERALSQLIENRRYSGRQERRRDYLLTGLITCEGCGSAYVGRSTTSAGGRYRHNYYKCSDDRPGRRRRGPAGHAPAVRADWLEDIVWADVRQFLMDPGAVLERIREAEDSGEAERELMERQKRLTRELATLQKGRERLHRLYVLGEIDDEGLDERLAELRSEVAAKKTALEAVEARLASREAEREAARTTQDYLSSLRGCVAEVDEDAAQRRELCRLLVGEVSVGRDGEGKTEVTITYRFGPPAKASASSEAEPGAFAPGDSDSLRVLGTRGPYVPRTMSPILLRDLSGRRSRPEWRT